jgi:hypothetical protein
LLTMIITEQTPVKARRHRRTLSQMDELLTGVLNILGEYDDPITIRHLFYRCSGAGLVQKTEDGYNQLRGHLVRWRRSKQVSMDAFIDGSRWHYGSFGSDDLSEYLLDCTRNYRRNLWQTQPYYVEVWVEKDAIASIVNPIVSEWTLRLFPARGDASMSSLYQASRLFKDYQQQGRRSIIIYLGDYDESGIDIPNKIESNLWEDHDCYVEMRRVAINREQIDQFNLPTRPPKGTKRGQVIDVACEIDVLKPSDIRHLLNTEIENLVNRDELMRMRAIEDAERQTMGMMARNLKGGHAYE